MPDRELAELAASLVAIPSANPDLVSGGDGEARIAAEIARWAERAGLEVSLDDARPGRPNVVATARGSGDGRSLLLNAHTDTVEPGLAGTAPRIEGDRLFGRGAYDMKSSLAALLLAARDAAAGGLAGDVVVAGVADEEWASVGTEALLRDGPRPDGAIVAEPTELGVGVTHKGFVGFEIETRGRAAHGSRRDLGIDAIVRMGPVLVALGELDERLGGCDSHPLLGSGSVHASVVKGGTELSTYPDRCVLRGERRTLPGETAATVETELLGLVARCSTQADVRLIASRAPFVVDPADELVSTVRAEADSDLVGLPFWTDAALFAEAGIPTVVYGPLGGGAHADDEWVDLPSVERVRNVVCGVARTWCSRARGG